MYAIRERHSESKEFAIQRKYMNVLAKGPVEEAAAFAEDNPVVAEYLEYNRYVEQCKEDAKNPDLYKAPEPTVPNDLTT